MKYRVITRPEVYPVSVQFLKDQLRITHDGQDSYLLSLIQAATESANDYTGRQLNRAELLAYCKFNGSYVFQLHRGPVVSVTTVKFVNISGEEITLAEADYYLIREELSCFVVVKNTSALVNIDTDRIDAVQITYLAGYNGEEGSLFPEDLVNAVALKASRLYTNPDDAVDEKISISENLLRRFRCPIV